jgi:hypothetical protein
VPASGIPEDPVTGSAHTALAPFWSHRLGCDSLTGLQASDRAGLVHTAVHGNRVHLTGRAVTVLDGALNRTAAETAPCCGENEPRLLALRARGRLELEDGHE